MQVIHTLHDLHHRLRAYRNPAVVPTMGNLHAGHLALVERARTMGDVTVATIFVNRLQFGPNEDFDTYPRTLDADCAKLRNVGCNIVFAPTERELYAQPQTFMVQPPPELGDILEGEFRPGFFAGVATVVMKLLSCTQARSAVFGKKDYQQLMVIRQMVQQFAMPVDIVGVDTCRTESGLALSSRNGYLDPEQLEQATQLSRTLRTLADGMRATPECRTELEQQAMDTLRAAGWKPDYITARRRHDLQIPQANDRELVVLAAARLGHTRLIDNLEV